MKTNHEDTKARRGEGDGLPPGWTAATVGELYRIVGGGTPATAVADYWDGDIPWITSADIAGLRDIRPRKRITQKAIENSATNLVPSGSLIVVTRVGLGKVALANTALCFSQDSHALLGDPSIVFPEYALYYLSDAVQAFKYQNRGTTIAGVTKKQLADLPFLLPPIGEQRRIVAKIEELLTKLDAGVAALKRVQAALKRYRAAVLKAACEGRLVPQDPNDEPAAKLLERILAERRAKWEADLRAKGKDLKKAKYEEPKGPETEGLAELPEGWCWATVEQLLDMLSGKAFHEKEYAETGVRLLQIANVAFGAVALSESVFLPAEYMRLFPQLVLQQGDVVMALNRPILEGELKIGMLTKLDVPSILYQRVGRFLFFVSSIKLYFYYFARSPLFVGALRSRLQGVDQPFVTKPSLMAILVPLPPLSEQARIVAEVEQRLSVVTELQKSVETSLSRAARLRQAALRRAFEGKLVT